METQEKIQNLQLDVKTHSLKINQIVERMDSHHNDTRQRFDDMKTLVKDDNEALYNKIVIAMREECKTLTEGLIKSDKENADCIKKNSDSIIRLENNQKWIILVA